MILWFEKPTFDLKMKIFQNPRIIQMSSTLWKYIPGTRDYKIQKGLAYCQLIVDSNEVTLSGLGYGRMIRDRRNAYNTFVNTIAVCAKDGCPNTSEKDLRELADRMSPGIVLTTSVHDLISAVKK